MKKYLVVILIVLVGGALLLVPMLKSEEEFVIPAELNFEGNPGTIVGHKSELKVKVNGDLAKVEVKYNGKTIKSWNKPTGDLSFSIQPDEVGTRTLDIHSYDEEGKSYVDRNLLRVLSDIIPEVKQAQVVNAYTHDETSFTQGLEFYQGNLYESTGLRGMSKISRIDIETGQTIEPFSIGLDATYFGEGITIMNDIIYQLTWEKEKCFLYDLTDTGIQIQRKEFTYPGQQGWGLCNDNEQLIMSDGTERITFRNPENFAVTKTIEVYNNNGPFSGINELEYIEGKIYANVWRLNVVIVIDPETGKVLEQIDCTKLIERGQGAGDVLNGIAYNEETGKTYMTGKKWPLLFEVAFSEPNLNP